MPCSCFGKKDKKCGVVAEEKYRSRDSKSREREPPSVAAPPQAPPPAATPPPHPPITPTTGGDARLRPEDDPDKANRRRDVVASFYSDQCELIGFKATGSRPPSTHVGSTVDGPAATSSPAASSPGSTRSAASCRAELAEKRREFFKQLTLEDDNSSCGGSRPISRLTDPGSHTTPRHSQEYHHYSLPHPPKPTPRAFKYSLPLTPLHPSATPAASEETQPLLQPTNEHDPAVHHELIGSSEAPQVPVDASEPPGQAWVVEAPVCVAEPPQDVPQQDKDRPGLSSSPIPADLPSVEAASEPLLQLSAETQHLGEVRVWGGPEQLEGEPITGAPPLYDVSTQDYSQELLRVSPADCSQVLINVIPPVIEDMPTNDNSQVLVSVSTTVVEDSSSSDSSKVLVSVPSSVKVDSVIVDSSEAVVSEDLVESAAVTVNTAASEQSQRSLEQKQYVQQTSFQSDDERVAEGSCILIDEAFPPRPQEAAATQGNNHIICHTTTSPPHELRHNNVSVEDELSQRSHISTTVAAQELPLASTDEGYDEVSRQSALHPDIIEHSQQDTQRMVPEAEVRPELEEIVLNNHHEQVHQALSFTVDPYFLTSAEEPEDLQIEQMLHQSGPQLEEKHLPKQRSQLPEVPVQHHNQVKSTVEIVECIPKVSPPLESALPLRMAPSPLNTVEAALPLLMTATTRQDEVESLPPAPPTPPVEDEPLPPPPPTPPLLDEPLPPAPPTPPISSEHRMPPATCGVHLMSSSVMEDDGLGSEIDDALSSLECLSEEGNSSERAAAS